MSEPLSNYTHVGGFGQSEAGRPLAFGAAVDQWGRELKLQGVRVRNAGTENPYIKITRAGESIGVEVDPNDEDFIKLLAALQAFR